MSMGESPIGILGRANSGGLSVKFSVTHSPPTPGPTAHAYDVRRAVVCVRAVPCRKKPGVSARL